MQKCKNDCAQWQTVHLNFELSRCVALFDYCKAAFNTEQATNSWKSPNFNPATRVDSSCCC